MRKIILINAMFIFSFFSIYCMQETEFIGSEVPLLVKQAHDYLNGKNGKEKNALTALSYFSKVIKKSKNITRYYAKLKVAELCYEGIDISNETYHYISKDVDLAKKLWVNVYNWAVLEREKQESIQSKDELYKILTLTIGNLARFDWEQKKKQDAHEKFKLCLTMIKNLCHESDWVECKYFSTYYLAEIAEDQGKIESALSKYKKLLAWPDVCDHWKEKAQHRIDNLYIKIFPTDDENIE